MTEHPNIAILKKGYEAFGEGDMATLNELFDPSVTYHVPGNSQISGDYQGRDAVFGFFGKLAELSGGTIKIETHDFLLKNK